jgi:hypothetical protein
MRRCHRLEPPLRRGSGAFGKFLDEVREHLFAIGGQGGIDGG